MTLLVEFQVRKRIHDAGCKMSRGLPKALEQIVEGILDEAISRAKSERRKTVMPRDLPGIESVHTQRIIPTRSHIIRRPDSGIIGR